MFGNPKPKRIRCKRDSLYGVSFFAERTFPCLLWSVFVYRKTDKILISVKALVLRFHILKRKNKNNGDYYEKKETGRTVYDSGKDRINDT